MNLRLLAVCALALLGSGATLAQAQVTPLMNYVGMPFSGVRTFQGGRNFVDGNRVDRGTSERLYRDGQGRTRIERDVPAQVRANNPNMEATQITINDPVSGDRIQLHAATKSAIVWHNVVTPAGAVPTAAPAVTVTFARRFRPATDPAWSAPVALGEKTFDGLRATGQRRQYTIPVGELSNEKPIVLTVEQWYSPELSLIVAQSGTSTLGGDFSNQVENVVRGEPSPALFAIPADYSRTDVQHRDAAAQ